MSLKVKLDPLRTIALQTSYSLQKVSGILEKNQHQIFSGFSKEDIYFFQMTLG